MPLDEETKKGWRALAESVERAGMSLWPWIEVARNPAMADSHPEWMAAKENGSRDSARELCLTEPGLREFVAQRVLAELRAHAGPVDNFWVGQNDGGKAGCYCERCTAERLAHGGRDRRRG